MRLDRQADGAYLKGMTDQPTAAVLIIGDEILSGRTKDANLACIALKLGSIGIEVIEACIVSDDEAAIVEAVNTLRAAYTYVFTTGGIGPTHDDITADCIAKAFGVPIDVREDALAILEAHYQHKPGELNEPRMRMARIPDGAELIDNPVSKAPGFRLGNVHVMAGIPILVEVMMDGLLEKLSGGKVLLTHTISAFIAESHVAPGLRKIQEDHPDVRIGSYPFLRDGKSGASLVIRSTDDAALTSVCALVRDVVRATGETIQADIRS